MKCLGILGFDGSCHVELFYNYDYYKVILQGNSEQKQFPPGKKYEIHYVV